MKKTTLLLALGLCFGISGLAQTKKQPTKRPTKFSAEVDSMFKATPLFVKLDTNRNGSISKQELQELSNISKQIDINKDNKLSAVELLGNANGIWVDAAPQTGGWEYNHPVNAAKLAASGRNAADVAPPRHRPLTTSPLYPQGLIGVILNNLEDRWPWKGDSDFNDIFAKFDTNKDNKLSTVEIFGQGIVLEPRP